MAISIRTGLLELPKLGRVNQPRKTRPWWERSKEELGKRGITYSEVAKKLGVEKATVGHWMVGRREPPLDKLLKLSQEILGMSISELCGEDAWFVVDSMERSLLEKFRKMKPEEQAGFAAALGLREAEESTKTSKRASRK